MINKLQETKTQYQKRINELDEIISSLEDEKEALEEKVEVIDDMIADEVAKLKKNQ